MKLTVLGSGTSDPHPQRTSSGYWLETSSGTILLDCSASAVMRMAQENLDWANLDAIWISHFHLDHIGGLAPFLFGTKYAHQTRERKKPLKIFSPKGLKTIIKKISDTADYKLLEQNFPLEFIEVEHLENFRILPDIEAVAISVPHTEESMAIHLRDGEKTLVYTGDTGFAKELGDFARDVDVFVCECSFVDESPVKIHLALPEAMHLARYAKPKKMILTHLYQVWDDINFQKEIEKFSPRCEVIQAKDGLKIKL